MLLNNFSDRLKEERIKLNLSQAELGELCGVKKLAQFNYEKGERFPDAAYLMQATKVGIDVNYLLTGNRSTGALSSDEVFMLEKIRQTSPEIKNQILMLLLGGNNATTNVVNQSSHTGSGDQFNAKKQKVDKRSRVNNFNGGFGGDYVEGDKK